MNEPTQLSTHPYWSSPKAEKIRKQVANPWMLKLYMLQNLPAGLFSGMRVESLNDQTCVTTVPYSWRTRNPFKSTYFAVLAMAAELSSGAPAMVAVRGAPESVALIIVGMKAEFIKKASGRTTFTCSDVPKLNAAVEETMRTGEPVTTTVTTEGRNPEGVVVARFEFSWSFKRRSRPS
jgi:hypothetical protein